MHGTRELLAASKHGDAHDRLGWKPSLAFGVDRDRHFLSECLGADIAELSFAHRQQGMRTVVGSQPQAIGNAVLRVRQIPRCRAV